LASKVVAFAEGATLFSNENGKKPLRESPDDASLEAAGAAVGAPPDLGCGAGVGSGTLSAKTGALASTPQTIAAKTAVAPQPDKHLSAMSLLSSCAGAPARTLIIDR
jgi:hypothetical protein